ncbi:conjugal transfer protein TraN, partial [Thioalkalivibrio sp. ALgr3]|uniref:conjugal transfer protein TraN n=1 Tax=Thioalkalivibrio sp. ALgr3 TaxID=1239292 RepID=UPI0018C9DFDC
MTMYPFQHFSLVSRLIVAAIMLSPLAASAVPQEYNPDTFDGSQYVSCTAIQTECVRSGTEEIAGTDIHRDCWEYESTYACLTEDQNFCTPLKEEGCFEVSSECVEEDHRGQCIRESRVFQCEEDVEPQPEETVHLGEEFVIVEDKLDYEECEGAETDSYCEQQERVCVEGPETR